MRRMRRSTAIVHGIEAAAFCIVCVGFLTYGLSWYKSEHSMKIQNSGEQNTIFEEAQGFFNADTVTYDGKIYRKNTYVKAILCMGIDRTGNMSEVQTSGSGGQADGIVLAAHDTAHDTMKFLMIPRDTMTPILLTDLNGNVLGKNIQHLTLAYAYGDGKQKSCEYMKAAVSELFYGFPIDHYLAADMEVISILNDLVGGVAVKIPTEGMESADPSFIYGSTVRLHGKQAEKFVRYRDVKTDHSALYRMDQQQEYMERFIQTVREKAKTDEGIVMKLFDHIREYMVTDMEKAEYLKVAVSSLNTDSDNTVYTLSGQGVTTEQYDEFYPDEKGMKQMILSLFYREEK